jgi:hypothetical protein
MLARNLSLKAHTAPALPGGGASPTTYAAVAAALPPQALCSDSSRSPESVSKPAQKKAQPVVHAAALHNPAKVIWVVFNKTIPKGSRHTLKAVELWVCNNLDCVAKGRNPVIGVSWHVGSVFVDIWFQTCPTVATKDCRGDELTQTQGSS